MLRQFQLLHHSYSSCTNQVGWVIRLFLCHWSARIPLKQSHKNLQVLIMVLIQSTLKPVEVS